MKITNQAAALLLSLSLTSASQVLAHDLPEDCSAEIDAVRVALNDYNYTSTDGFCLRLPDDHKNGQRTCDGLNAKLDDADAKITQHKIPDADKKLGDFRVALDSLAFRRKPIISMAEYTSVSDPLATAAACVAGLY